MESMTLGQLKTFSSQISESWLFESVFDTFFLFKVLWFFFTVYFGKCYNNYR